MGKKILWRNSEARSDLRLLKVKDKYGYIGVYVYWEILELLFQNEGKRLKLNNDPHIEEWIKKKCGTAAIESFKLGKFIKDCVNEFRLFEANNNQFWSDLQDNKIYVFSDKYPGIN